MSLPHQPPEDYIENTQFLEDGKHRWQEMDGYLPSMCLRTKCCLWRLPWILTSLPSRLKLCLLDRERGGKGEDIYTSGSAALLALPPQPHISPTREDAAQFYSPAS